MGLIINNKYNNNIKNNKKKFQRIKVKNYILL